MSILIKSIDKLFNMFAQDKKTHRLVKVYIYLGISKHQNTDIGKGHDNFEDSGLVAEDFEDNPMGRYFL